MAALEHYLFELEATYSSPALPGELSYEELVKRGKDTPPSSYRFSQSKQQDVFAANTMQDLITLIRAWRNKNNGQNAASFKGSRESKNQKAGYPPKTPSPSRINRPCLESSWTTFLNTIQTTKITEKRVGSVYHDENLPK